MKFAKKMMCLILTVLIIWSFSSCSAKTEMTDENISQTVKTVETALKEFDTKTLEKYVESETLSYIVKFAKSKSQFADLGKAIFEELTIETDIIDIEKGTVTLKVTNRDLSAAASMFAFELKNQYSATELLSKLNDDNFLDKNLADLSEKIAQQPLGLTQTVTLTVSQGKRNLVLTFNENAEDAVSGGALGAIKTYIGI